MSHVTLSETEIKLYFTSAAEAVLKLFQNHLSDIEHAGKYS